MEQSTQDRDGASKFFKATGTLGQVPRFFKKPTKEVTEKKDRNWEVKRRLQGKNYYKYT